MKQLTFEFIRELEYIICFPPEVERELLKQMAKAMWQASQIEGEKKDEHITNKE